MTGRPWLDPGEIAGCLAALGNDPIETCADLGGTARDLTLALHLRHDCVIVLIDIDRRGDFPEAPSDWIADYRGFLTDQGVAEDRVRVVRDAGSLRSYDLICNLANFGDTRKIKRLALILDTCLHAESMMLLDIRKGSGSHPFLADWGTCETLSSRDDDGEQVSRTLFRPKPPEMRQSDPVWSDLARQMAGPDGFFRDNGTHSFLYIPRGDTLVVTFDNLDIAMNKREDRRPWGFDFIEKQGWSMLGVLAGGWTWYRDPWVSEQFDALKQSGFFRSFRHVVFYGASMGGYAACAFSPAAPGCDVVAISPQSTLDKSVVPWESRYQVVWDSDFSGPYGDAADASRAARRVSILYDPFEPLDARHVARFTDANVQRLPAPFLGHRLGSSLNQMGVLSPIILKALAGSLTDHEFHTLLRRRKTSPRYQRELFNRAVAKGHRDLARSMGRFILTLNPNRAVRQGLKDLG